MQKVKSEYLKSNMPFKLNNCLFRKNLSKISQRHILGKQNLSRIKPKPNEVEIHKNQNKNKVFSIHKKFIKHNNKIQDNMALFNHTTMSFNPSPTKTSLCLSHHRSHHVSEQLTKYLDQGLKVNVKAQGHQKYLIPKTLQGIEQQFEQKYCKLQENSRIIKEKFYQNKKQVNTQISEIYQKNKHLYMLSRFTLLELKSYYSAILNFAKGDTTKFKYAFQIMLNLTNSTVRQNILNESLKDFASKGLTFSHFLKLFTGIQEKLRKQAIIDYFQILLEELNKNQFSYQDLLKTFGGRMKKQNATDLSDLLYEKLGKDENETISKKQIHTLCYEDEHFCNQFYTLNSDNMFNRKIKDNDDF